jgi:hypothetical protein
VSVLDGRPGYPCVLSGDERYRYTLWRQWNEVERPRYMLMVGLNPSTADATRDDPTIRRCVGFARAEGFDALCMVNLFAFRATNPRVMMAEVDPVGKDNDGWISLLSIMAGMVVAAWGASGGHRDRDVAVKQMLLNRGRHLYALGETKEGHPRHPLYLPKSARPVLYA